MNPLNYTDGYKLDHRRQYPEETTLVYSNWTPRKSRIESVDKVVFFGMQYFIKRYLLKEFKEQFFDKSLDEVCGKYQRRINNYLGVNSIGTSHIEALHKLGYLPLEIKALPEGRSSKIGIPQFTIVNTDSNFFWLVNYLETLFSCTIWGPSTTGTISKQYNKILSYWSNKTAGNVDFVPFQCHDFSMRGMYGVDAAMMSGAAHLLSFVGSDTVSAIDWLEEYYNANSDKELVACSVSATEHAIMMVGTGFYIRKENLSWELYGEAEFAVFERLLTEVYPEGILSIVSDTWDLWKVLTEYLPKLRDVILSRNGKLVIRPDSGNPVDIICGKLVLSFDDLYEIYSKGTAQNGMLFIDKNQVYKFNLHNLEELQDEYGESAIDIFCEHDIKRCLEYGFIEKVDFKNNESDKGVVELLWNTFGGTVNDLGYKILDPHIGTIYGDSITLDRANEICKRLESKGFASINWIAGAGSYSFQYQTRDTMGFACKAVYAETEFVEGNHIQKYCIPIFKDPITDDGTKKSAKGLLCVTEKDGEYSLKDQCSWEEEKQSCLQTVFKDGVLLKDWTLQEVRDNIKKD